MSQTGNTEKVAKAIYEEIRGEKTISRIEELEGFEEYDVIFLGFPIIHMGPPEGIVNFLKESGARKKVAMFVTHGADFSLPPLQEWLQRCRNAAVGTEFLGLFSCQGEVNVKVREAMMASSDPELQMYAKMAPLADGQPDEGDLERARAFTRSITEEITK